MITALLIIGIVVLALSILAPIIARATTPTNLRGFYSVKYFLITAIGAAAGIAMIVAHFLLK